MSDLDKIMGTKMAVETNAIERLRTAPMTSGQWIVVLICIATLALDGYDILSIAFAAPGMTEESILSRLQGAD